MRFKKLFFGFFLFLFIFQTFPLFLTAQYSIPALDKVDSLRSHSRYFVEKGDFPSALSHLEAAENILKTHQIDTLLGLILLDFAEPLLKSGNFVEAIKKCHQAFELYDSLKMDNRKGQALNQLGVAYKYSGDLNKAREYYEKAVSIIEKSKSEEGLGSALNNLATVLNEIGQYQQAESITFKAIDLVLSAGDTTKAIPLYFNLAINMDNQKRYDDALEYLKIIYGIATKYDLTYAMSGYYNGKGIVLKHKGDFEAAEKNYFEALDYAERRNFPKILNVVHENLSMLYKEKGDFEKALNYFEKAMMVKDSLFSVEKQNQIEKLREEFEAVQKEKEIELLKKDRSISKLQIRSLSLLSVLAILIFGGGIFYQRFRIKKNRQLAAIKEEKLKQELELKSQQITSKTLEMVRKNDFLSSLSKQLNLAQKENKIDSSTYNQIEKEIGFHHQMEDDWQQFEVAFNDVHKGYFESLKANFPELTSNELRHCALLKLGLSIKETANLLSIAPPSVKMSRNRIKKKLKLSAEDSLPNFLISL